MKGQFLVIAANKAQPAQADFVLATRNVFTSLEEAEQFADARTQPKGVLFVVEAPFPIPRTLVADDWVERDPSTKVCRLAPALVLPPTKAATSAKRPIRQRGYRFVGLYQTITGRFQRIITLSRPISEEKIREVAEALAKEWGYAYWHYTALVHNYENY
jgi:hypothetical protein